MKDHISRRDFLRYVAATTALAVGGGQSCSTQNRNQPNIILIAIDDLNDWIGCMGGHAQAKTPNIDRLAKDGMLFTNAHCQSPVCNPSRLSMMLSLYPSSTGLYFLNPDREASIVAKENSLLPDRFQNEGYYVTAAGKLFHGYKQNKKYFPNYAGSFGSVGPIPEYKLTNFPGHRLWDWGPTSENDEEMPDHKIAEWAKKQLTKKYDSPFFLGVGFYRPHVPLYAPKKWFDLYPLDSLELPLMLQQDMEDLSEYAINLTRLKHVTPKHDWVKDNNEWKPLVQSYLACVSFVDNQVGMLLDALEESDYKKNTFIVLYSDHGFHLGEKERWGKRSLWEESTRVPMIVAGPGIDNGMKCNKPVQLLDIYPTLIDLAGLTSDSKLEGHSLVPLLTNPSAYWPYMARTSFGRGNISIRSERYRYIRYNDGSEEFYDHLDDPYEWKNLIEDRSMHQLIAAHRALLPKINHPILGSGSTGHKAYEAAESRKSPPIL